MHLLRALVVCAAMQLITTTLVAQTLTTQLSQESADKLAAAAREKGNAIRGVIIQSQQKMGCVTCHGVGDQTLVGPDITNLKPKLTDVEIVEALLDPSKKISKGYETSVIATVDGRIVTGRIIKQSDDEISIRHNSGKSHDLLTIKKTSIEEMKQVAVSNMPEKLMDQLSNRQEFLDLVRYVMEIQSASSAKISSSVAGGQSISKELQGLVLIKKLNCEACHQQLGDVAPLTAKQAPDLLWSSARIDPEYITEFVSNPHQTKPGTTMPGMLAQLEPQVRKQSAKELAHYIASLSDARFTRNQTVEPAKVSVGKELFHSVGCMACHSPRDNSGRELLAEASVPLGKPGEKYSLATLAEFLEDPLASRASGHMPNMKLSHFEAVDLAHYLASLGGQTSSPFELDGALAAAGKEQFAKLGCVQCHQVEKDRQRPAMPVPAELRVDHGCLAEGGHKAPRFDLSPAEREAIKAALHSGQESFSQEQQINMTLTSLRCLNCHQRDDLGGVSPERNPHFQTTNPNLGPQGRIPPTLTKVGAKLKSDWMRQVFVTGRSIRPYQLTRMPQFGAANVEQLIELFQQTDSLPPIEHGTFQDLNEFKKIATELVGSDGLNCVACHTFQLKEALTMPAVDLTEMADRLQKDWFYHYMRAPQQLSPNTVMPSFWPGGRAIRKDVLGGDTDDQIEALWQYLLDGRQARQPRGLVIEPIELLATDEAVMLRRSYPEVGKRGIGVGYPHQVNLVFDAEQMRLAGLWEGKFADPGGVWRSQGHGRVRPLGRDVIYFAKGPDVDNLQNPWMPDDGRPPQHQFRGYSLDSKQRPTFRYEFDGILIEESYIDGVDQQSGKPFLDRTIKFISEQPREAVRLRLASGPRISSAGEREYLVNDKVTVVTKSDAKVIRLGDVELLEVHRALPQGESTVSARYQW